jgi:pimeloyl-ACP methyl ester carboxylesterase
MAAARGSLEPLGRLIAVDGRLMHIVSAGTKSMTEPTVLLEAGSFGFSADWAVVQEKLAARGVHSVAYDRAGLGYSQPGPAPRDGLAIVSDLEKLLLAAREDGPFILVGHSMAGLHVHLFAGRNPGKVAGVVLVDAVTPTASDHPVARRMVAQYARLSRLAARAAMLGLLKPFAGFGDRIGLTARAAPHKRWAFAHGPHSRVAADEVQQWEAAAQQARDAGPLDPDWPVAVVTAGAMSAAPHKTFQSEPARLSRRGYNENVAAAGHASLLGVGHADAIVRAIEHVRGAVKA